MQSMRRLLAPLLSALSLCSASAEWKPLFNGKDLTGWSGDPRLWKVEQGVIIGETNATDKKLAANSFLIWQGGEPADFELEYQARVTGNNSGMQYRSKVFDAAAWRVSGYQMDLHPNQPYLGMLYEEGGRGISCLRGQRVTLADKADVTGKLEIPDVKLEEWNSYRIVARGNVLQHFVNGVLATEITDVDPAKRAAKGVIALQIHAGPPMKAEFKELRIQKFKLNF
ncbi:MAG: hypothetical protein RLZZ522_1697 [Verrucomicrobiota bacterium]